jgi:hypothetical protein
MRWDFRQDEERVNMAEMVSGEDGGLFGHPFWVFDFHPEKSVNERSQYPTTQPPTSAALTTSVCNSFDIAKGVLDTLANRAIACCCHPFAHPLDYCGCNGWQEVLLPLGVV